MRASRILEEFGATGMFFVPTGFVGTKTVAEARGFFGFVEGCDEPAMTWEDLEGLKGRGHEIGNDTHTHRILARLTAQERADEVVTQQRSSARDWVPVITSPGPTVASPTSPPTPLAPSSTAGTPAVPPPSAGPTSRGPRATRAPSACAGTTS